MNLARISKLLRVVKARSRLEQSRLAAVKTAQQTLIAEATAIESSAREALAVGEELNGQALKSYGLRQKLLEKAAQERREKARSLEPHKATHQAALRASLRQETAWKSLSDAAEQERREETNAREEERREAFVQIRDPENF